MSLKKLFYIVLLFALTYNCGRPPGEYSGLCSADCSNSLIATDKMTITSLVKTTEIKCNAGQIPGDPHAKFPIRFKVERPSYEISPDDNNTSAESIEKLPATSISYDYQVLDGVLDGIDNFNTSCTDSCGTGLLQVTPVCGQKDNIVRILIQSGSIAEEITFTVKGITSE